MAKTSQGAVTIHEPKVIAKSVEVNPENLISQAIAKGTPIETMEKLFAMRRELKSEWSKEQFFIALSKLQKAIPTIQKHKKVMQGGKVRYSYAPLDDIISQIKDFLEQFGFSFTIKTKQIDKSVTAICITHHAAGHSEETEFTVPVDLGAFMNDSQKVASALTYAKRYAFCNAFGIMTGDEDDDSQATELNIDKPVVQKPVKDVTPLKNEGLKVPLKLAELKSVYNTISSIISDVDKANYDKFTAELNKPGVPISEDQTAVIQKVIDRLKASYSQFFEPQAVSEGDPEPTFENDIKILPKGVM